MKKQNILLLLVLIAICFISRIPQLISPNLVLDGDECIEALMAKHLYQGKDISFYFYGQLYGFSLFETIVIAIYYALFHISDITVKLAMLTLWTGGIIFFYRALRSINMANKWLPVLVTLVFILCPAWAVWSMKARGGYLTSFLLTAVVLSLLFNKSKIVKNSTWLFIGILLIFIYQSQPLFLPGLVPLLGYALYKNFSLKKMGAAIAGAAPVVVLFLIIKNNSKDYYSTSPFSFNLQALKSIGNIPLFLFNHFNGYYYFSYTSPPSFCGAVLSITMISIIALIIIAAVIAIVRNKNNNLLFYCSILSVLFTFLYIIFRVENNYRYFLPITGYTLLSFFILTKTIKVRHVLVNSFLASFSLVGVCSMAGFYNYSYNYTPKPPLLQTIKFAEDHHIQYAFSGALLQWQIMFYSNEKIICRWRSEIDRYQPYVDKTDSAYSKDPAISAVILPVPEYDSAIRDSAIDLHNGYAILPDPRKTLLEKIGYNFSIRP